MQPAKVDVLIAQFCYGGNSSVSMVIPDHCPWLSGVAMEAAKDDRIGRFAMRKFHDTPITMSRNASVKFARENGFDVILMLDSDNKPDCELGTDPDAKPFWKTSFDFLYDRLMLGLPTVAAAPYCGGGDEENIFMFYWKNWKNGPRTRLSLEQYTRNHAAIMSGMQPVAAGPTGVAMYTMSAFDLMKPPYFRYEWTDAEESAKASTEDVYNFREISLSGWLKHNTDVVFSNWDAWASHYKVVEVRKPVMMKYDQVCDHFAEAVRNGVSAGDRLIDKDFTKNLPAEIQEQIRNAQPYEEAEPEQTIVEDEPPEPAEQESSEYGTRELFGRTVTTFAHVTSLEELKVLKSLVNKYADRHTDGPIHVLEIGSWAGESAISIAAGLPMDGSTVTTVDTFEGTKTEPVMMKRLEAIGGPDALHRLCLSNCEHDSRIDVVRSSSKEFAENTSDKYDIVFIDGDHTYEGAKQDIELWRGRVVDGGLIVGHDYTIFPGVQAAVDEVFGGLASQIPGTSMWSVRVEPGVVTGSAVGIFRRRVFDRTITSVGFCHSMESMETLSEIVELVAMARNGEDLRIVEVGTWVGEGALALAHGLKTDTSSIMCVDDYSGSGQGDIPDMIDAVGGPDALENYFNLNAQHDPRIKLIRKSSKGLLKNLDYAELDLVFIDANHTYEEAKADIVGWQYHLKPDGVLVIDDYSEAFSGVVKAVNELFVDREIPAQLMAGTGIVVVKNADIKQWMKTTKSQKL